MTAASVTRRRTVVNEGVELACVDHGGTGPDLVLMHGAGMSQRSLVRLVSHLTSSARVVTFDFRGHGDTPMAPWTMDSAVSDLEAVVGAFGLHRPAVAGHSLGGMVAAEYARRHPECPAAVNVDGHGQGAPSQYVGKDPELAAAWMEECKQRAAALTGGRLVAALAVVSRLRGSPPPSREAIASITSVVEGLDLLATYREVRVPLLVINAHGARTGLSARLMKDPEDYAGAFRAGIRRDVTALSQVNGHVELAEIDASHALVRTHPQETAALMAGFLKRHS